MVFVVMVFCLAIVWGCGIDNKKEATITKGSLTNFEFDPGCWIATVTDKDGKEQIFRYLKSGGAIALVESNTLVINTCLSNDWNARFELRLMRVGEIRRILSENGAFSFHACAGNYNFFHL